MLLVQGDWKTRKWKSEIGLFAKVPLMDKGGPKIATVDAVAVGGASSGPSGGPVGPRSGDVPMM